MGKAGKGGKTPREEHLAWELFIHEESGRNQLCTGPMGPGWQRVAKLRVVFPGNGVRPFIHPEDRAKLPPGAIVADTRLHRGGGAYTWRLLYTDLHRACARCRREFTFTAAEQRRWYEEIQLPIDVQQKYCPPCRGAVVQARKARQALAEACARLRVVPDEPEASLALARASAELRELEGVCDLNRAVGAARRAQKTPALAAEAALVLQRLQALRRPPRPGRRGGWGATLRAEV